MTRTGTIVLIAVFVAGCGGYGPKHLPSAEYTAMKRADASLRTLNDHRLDSVFVYGPLLAEAEKTVSEMDAITATDKGDARNAYYAVKSCVKAIAEGRDEYKEFHDREMEAANVNLIAASISEVTSYIRIPSEVTAP